MAVSLELERQLGDPVMGIDEAGRGPLAGGVYAAAVSAPLALADGLLAGAWSEINDSKKLTERTRARLAEVVRATPGCVWTVASASPAEIDSLNILRATHLAMRRAVEQVIAALGGVAVTALVDGLPVTTKEDSDYHGFGLKSIRHTAEKYGGGISVQTGSNFFSLQVLLPVRQEN